MRVTVANRGPDAAALHVLPQLWARNTWSWDPAQPRAALALAPDGTVRSSHPALRGRRLEAYQGAEWLFCDNDTNTRRLYGTEGPRYPKDAINDAVVTGDRTRANPDRTGTKCAALAEVTVAAGGSAVLLYRLAVDDARSPAPPMTRADAERVVSERLAEADAFYAALQRDIADPDARLVQRQALAGMLWSKQLYHFDVRRWLDGDPAGPVPPESRKAGRDSAWRHLNNDDVVSMPDKWEYPWYAAWDLAFHCVAFALVDPQFAKGQLILLAREWYMHPNGQLPAYEWEFGDVNPPVHAWAAWRVYQMDRALTGTADRGFLVRVFHKLMLNFTWWVNRKDSAGRNIFQGGFLGLDNIGVFDRSKPLPTGGTLSQSDGTAWMAMYTLDLMRIALELAREDSAYEDIATKFFEHFLYIAAAMNGVETPANGLWDEEDRFYYDVLTLPDGRRVPLRVRSLVGLIPLCAVEVLDSETRERFPAFTGRAEWMLRNRPDLAGLVSRWTEPGQGNRLLLSLLRRQRMGALLSRALDEAEFLSPYGIRSVSKVHAARPFSLEHEGTRFSVDYEPGESTSRLFGGNSNWRGPVWMPINYLLIESLHEFERFYGADFRAECPTGSGVERTLPEIAGELSRRLAALFLEDAAGRRPYAAGADHGDLVQFNEYFDGDTGRGLGASHQTGWTGLVALLLQPRHALPASTVPVPPGSA